MTLSNLLAELKSMGISSKILNLMKKIDRKDFLPKEQIILAYENIPLPLASGATISQPYTVAFMLEHLNLKPNQKVLEIGTGSGWNSALISELIQPKGKVYTVEIIPELVKFAKKNLKNYKNVKVILNKTSLGYKKSAPYDRIIQTAASESPEKDLLAQLKLNGIYLAPLGPSYAQKLVKILKTKSGLKYHSLGDFIFVPLIKP